MIAIATERWEVKSSRVQESKGRNAAVTPLRKAVSSDPRQAIFANTSLAPLSWFHGSRVTTAHAHQCCRFPELCEDCAVANEIDYEIDYA